jgi:DNA-directed RNA polymerase subunit RPC12/RpoP
MSTGIDYGMGISNVNRETGIRYGVISQNSINLDCTDEFEQDYGEPTCPECGNTVVPLDHETVPEDIEAWQNYSKHGCDDYACVNCKHTLDSSDVFSDEPLGFNYSREGYKLTNCLDSDIFVLESPYYTFAQFCSPCVPGAGNLDNPMPDGAKTYCLGHDWFEDLKAPYPVYLVATNEQV